MPDYTPTLRLYRMIFPTSRAQGHYTGEKNQTRCTYCSEFVQVGPAERHIAHKECSAYLALLRRDVEAILTYVRSPVTAAQSLTGQPRISMGPLAKYYFGDYGSGKARVEAMISALPQ